MNNHYHVKTKRSSARILLLTNFAGEELIFPAIKAGAMGYHLKDSSPETLIEAIRQVNQGVASLHPSIAKKLLDELQHTDKQPLADEPLTHREVEVLRLIAQGYENRDIAEKLVISEATVRTHVSSISWGNCTWPAGRRRPSMPCGRDWPLYRTSPHLHKLRSAISISIGKDRSKTVFLISGTSTSDRCARSLSLLF